MWIVTSCKIHLSNVIATFVVIDYESPIIPCNVQVLVLGNGTLADSVCHG